MRAKRWKLIAAALVVVAASAPLHAASDLRKLAPPEPLFFVWVKNTEELRKKWATTPIARFWNDPQIKLFTSPLRKEIASAWEQLRQRSKLAREDWFRFFPGEIAFFCPGLRDLDEVFEVPLCFAAHTGLPREAYLEWIGRYIATLPPDATKRRYEVGDVTVRAVEYRREIEIRKAEGEEATARAPEKRTVRAFFQYAFARDTLLITDGNDDVMRQMIRRPRATATPELPRNPAYARVHNLLSGQADVVVFSAPGSLIKYISSQVAKQSAGKVQMFNFDALGLDGIRALAVAARIGEDRLELSTALALAEQGRGIVAILRRFKPSPLASLALTPDYVISYSSMAADWAGLYGDFRTMIREAVPPMDFALEMGLTSLENATTIRVDDAVAAVGDELAIFAAGPRGADEMPRQVLLVAIKNGPRVQGVIDAIWRWAQGKAKLEKTAFLGYTIQTVRPQLPAGVSAEELPPGIEEMGLSWCLMDDFLAVAGSKDLLKQVIQLKAGKATNSLAKSEKYRRARALLPERIDDFEMNEVGALGETLLKQLAKLSENPNFRSFAGDVFDFSTAVPVSAARRYFDLQASASFFDRIGLSSLVVMTSARH